MLPVAVSGCVSHLRLYTFSAMKSIERNLSDSRKGPPEGYPAFAVFHPMESFRRQFPVQSRIPGKSYVPVLPAPERNFTLQLFFRTTILSIDVTHVLC